MQNIIKRANELIERGWAEFSEFGVEVEIATEKMPLWQIPIWPNPECYIFRKAMPNEILEYDASASVWRADKWERLVNRANRDLPYIPPEKSALGERTTAQDNALPPVRHAGPPGSTARIAAYRAIYGGSTDNSTQSAFDINDDYIAEHLAYRMAQLFENPKFRALDPHWQKIVEKIHGDPPG